MSSLYSLTNAYKELLLLLYSEDADQQTVIDTLDSIEGAMEDKADCLASMMQGLQNDIDGLQKEIARLQARKKTLENSKERLKGYIFAAMQATGRKSFKTMLYSYGIRKAGARSLSVTVEPWQLPPEFQKVTIEADKAAIKKMMQEHGVEECDIARLEPASEYLSIK